MDTQYKIVSKGILKKKLRSLKARGKRVAFTNGCFDVVHFGHISYLEAAKKPGRVLIVGLNSDSSVKKIKGRGRPIIGENARARLLASLACVDFVTIFNEETPLNCIKSLKPDVLIKGADWKGKKVVGSDIVRSYGGKVEFMKHVRNYSTSNIIETVLKKCRK